MSFITEHVFNDVYYTIPTLNQLYGAVFYFKLVVKKFPVFYKTWGSFSCSHMPATEPFPQKGEIQSTPWHCISVRCILISSSQLHHHATSPQVYDKILCAFISSPTHAKCPAHLILLNLITVVIYGEENQKVRNSFRSYAMKVIQLILHIKIRHTSATK